VRRTSRYARLAAFSGLILMMGGALQAAPFGVRPLAFEENRGQTDGRVRFLARSNGYGLFLTPDEAVLSLRGEILRLRWEGATARPRVSGEGELPGKSHYLLGNDPAKWRTGIPSYGKVRYQDLYPGVDLVFYGNPRQLEYDFVLAPGADPRTVRLAVSGADRMEIDPAGDLVLHLGGREARLKKPVSYQETNGARREVASAFRRIEANRIGFDVGAFDPERPLVIDPVLAYSTYLGGTEYDEGAGIAVDAAGNAYVAGWTNSMDFPVANTIHRYDGTEAFAVKLAPDGSLIYSTFLGGSSVDLGFGIAVDATGHAYVAGSSQSPDFPLVNALQPKLPGLDAYVMKLDPSGSQLLYSTPIGGADAEYGYGVAIDSLGRAVVTGLTYSSDFPTVHPVQPSFQGVTDAFVAMLSPSGSQLVYATYLGGAGEDQGLGIAVDAAGNALTTGATRSAGFPTKMAIQGSLRGIWDAFVTKLDPAGALVYSTFLGGSSGDGGVAIAADAAGNAHVTGATGSPDFPLLNPLQAHLDSRAAGAFVSRLSPLGALVSSTFFGGQLATSEEWAQGIAVDASGIYLAGITFSSNSLPLKDSIAPGCPPALGIGCLNDAWAAKLNPTATAIVYSTLLGGSDNGRYGEEARGIAVDRRGNAYVVGRTSATDFPAVNAIQPFFRGVSDAFIAKIAANQPPVCSAAFTSPATLWPPNGKLVPVSIRGVTDPDGDPVTVTVSGVRQDEPLGEPGTPDALGIGTSTVQLRSDRAGGGDGRVYRITFKASDGNGGVCTGTVSVCVPHDQGAGKACGDGGPLFNSNGGAR
jgi:hypothetical protein